MGKKKVTQTNAATYGFIPHQGTTDEDAYRAGIQNVDFSSPIISAYGQAENELNDTVFEDALPDGSAERIKMGRKFNLMQRKGADLATARGNEAAWKAGQQGNLAGMTANKFVQTGGTSMGTQSGGFGSAFMGNLGASLGGA